MIDSGGVADFPGIGDGILKDLNVWMLISEHFRKTGIDLDGDEPGVVIERLEYARGKCPGSGAIFHDGSGMAQIKISDNRPA